jgi:hypothetical protein
MMFTISPMPMDDLEFLRVLEIVGKLIEEKKRFKGKDQRDGETKSHFFHQKEIQKEKEKPKNIDILRKNNKKVTKKDNHIKIEKKKFENQTKVIK